MSKYDLVLFDLDGTLTDSKEGIIRSLQHALSFYGIEKSVDELMKFIGPPIAEIFRELLNTDDMDEINRGVSLFRERYNRVGYLENAVYDGVEDMLCRLKSAGVKLAVATSKPEYYAKLILQNFKLDKYFDYICGASMDGKLCKKKDVITKSKDNVQHTKAVMIGDRFYDLVGAEEVGIDAIGVSYGYAKEGELRQHPNVCIASSPKEVADFILE